MPDNKCETKTEHNKLSFEEALGLLDKTVQAMEKGGLTLADATRLFEEGTKLARTCSEMLADTELRISRIQTAYGEQMQILEGESQVQEEDLC